MKANGITVVRDEAYFTKSINRDKRVSLKAKGLLGLVLDLPPSWDFSIRGLASICKEGKDAVGSTIQELVFFGYCELTQVREAGKFLGYHYTFYEVTQAPGALKPYPGKPDTVKPDTENPPQYKDINNSIKDKREGGAPARVVAPPAETKNPLSPAALVWLRIMKIELSEAGANLITKKIFNLAAWEDTLDGWLASGWTKNNIDGQVKRYLKFLDRGDYPVEDNATPATEKTEAELKEDETYRSLIYGDD